jgi:enoyl-CoA hydratase/carnithine racemase
MNIQRAVDAAPLVASKSDNGVTHLQLNRPDKLNALSSDLLDALQTALDEIAGSPEVRCVVISGSGKAFCAGHDLAEMRANPHLTYYQDLFARCSSVMQSIVSLPVPVIARVHGIATAAGCQLVASCDLAIASHNARFAVSGINVGLFCSTPAVALSRNIPAKQAFDMLFTGEFISAETAVLRGLVNQAVAAEALDDAVEVKVRTILDKDAQAVRYGKAVFQKQRQMALPDAYAFAGDIMARNMMMPETGERIDAFVEKRAPRIGQKS